MIYIEIFLAFFWPGILGYGGGPASIPLIQYEVVERYAWMSNEEFSEVLAFGNALPGPIATKMAGYIGYDVAGIPGAIAGTVATVAPSLFLMIVLLRFLMKHKESPKVKRMSTLVRPTIAVLLGIIAWQFIGDSFQQSGAIHTLLIAAAGWFALEKYSIHPAFVVAGGLVYGAIFLTP
ncbi:chromate transporter [Alteribacillus sp. JSM 102045]|uniref:chromate transporter n=1 Tax=Alteribacillus sp. JSM 102045 TaxID=1562101 RepID=UPI0035C009B4